MAEVEGDVPTASQQIKDFADNVTKTSLERLSLEGQLRQALISLERYIDEDEQILNEKEMSIPQYALSKAKGIVFLSLIKCGFVFAGCIGTGCVVVKNKKNEWSGPSSIACAGLSVGLLAGASKIDYIMILPNETAVQSFMSSGQLRIGGDLSVTLGTIGRTAYSNIGKGNVGPLSVIYSYSHSKGLYGGISLHGKVISVRKECNNEFYGFDVENEAILSGEVSMPYKGNEDYEKLVFILKSYCFEDKHIGDDEKEQIIKPHHVDKCPCKLCRKQNFEELDDTNPFKIPKKQNKHHHHQPAKKPNMTVNKLQKIEKINVQTTKTVISKETFMEPTPPPPVPDDGLYRYADNEIEIVGADVKIKAEDPWQNEDTEVNVEENDDEKMQINVDPYALNVRPWDRLIEPSLEIEQKKKDENKEKFNEIIEKVKDKQVKVCIDIDDDTKNDIEEEPKKHNKKYKKPQSEIKDAHYSDYNVEKYSLQNYDKNGYRIRDFSLLFQIDDVSYQTSIKLAGKLVSKQYIVNWPKKRECKAVIIVTSQSYSSLCDDNDCVYELRLICYDERDDDLIVYDIDIKYKNIKQIVNAINGAFVISPNKPWIVLESIFKVYNKRMQSMHESMIDISTKYEDENIFKHGDLIRANFGSLCQYGIYVGEGEVVCFRRRFPNNGSSAFKKYRLFLMVLTGRASKKITMKYMTLNEFIADCSRIEVIYYPIPSISPIMMVRKALIATEGMVHNCVMEYSKVIDAKLTLSPKEIIEDRLFSVIDGITATVNTISDAVTPIS